MKFVIILFFLTTLFSQKIDFEIKKYIYSLDKNVTLIGEIEFKKSHNLEINYSYPQKKRLSLKDDNLIVSEDNTTQTIDISTKPEVKYSFKIIKALFYNNQKELSKMFNIKKSGDDKIFTPKEGVKEVVKEVKIREKQRVVLIKIDFTNGDIIEIKPYYK